ncbi:hypothetical protein SCT_1412 [Sulfuricella sp. T08]|nr:hypothetical protein SCT_1412 [Sulfuricella sp. T08]
MATITTRMPYVKCLPIYRDGRQKASAAIDSYLLGLVDAKIGVAARISLVKTAAKDYCQADIDAGITMTRHVIRALIKSLI